MSLFLPAFDCWSDVNYCTSKASLECYIYSIIKKTLKAPYLIHNKRYTYFSLKPNIITHFGNLIVLPTYPMELLCKKIKDLPNTY